MDYRSGLVAGISLAVVALLLSSGSACSSTTTTASDAGTNDGAIAAATDVCKTSTNYNDCKTCCGPGVGYTASVQAYDQCMCQSACTSQCADSVCLTDPDASAAPQSADCTACLNNGPGAATCAVTAQNTCNNDADCVRFTQCVNEACAALPDTDGGH